MLFFKYLLNKKRQTDIDQFVLYSENNDLIIFSLKLYHKYYVSNHPQPKF